MFLTLVSIIVLISVREWLLLLARKKPAELRESEAVWLPDYAVKEPGANLRTATGAAVLALGLVKELSGEAQLERAQKQVCECSVHAEKSADKIYIETTEQRFNGPPTATTIHHWMTNHTIASLISRQTRLKRRKTKWTNNLQKKKRKKRSAA